jgi:alpha-galactosidase
MPPKIGPQNRSEEHGSWIIESIETGRVYRGHFNIINRGDIPNLPDGCCVEIPGYVDRNGLNMPVVGPLPAACAATCSASAHVQMMGTEAAVSGDVTLLKQAILHDPLVGAVCNPEEVWQMTDEMLVAQANRFR